MEMMLAGVDSSDPMVAMAAMVMVSYARRFSVKNPKIERFVRSYAPILAVLAAVIVRAVMEVTAGTPPEATQDYVELVHRGIGSGAVAVLAHSQARELFKKISTDLEDGEFMNEEDIETEEVTK